MGKCQFYLEGKKRTCGFEAKRGELYCGNHLHLAAANGASEDRVPCPLDGNHTIFLSELRSHIKKCPRIKELRKDQVSWRWEHAVPSHGHSSMQPCASPLVPNHQSSMANGASLSIPNADPLLHVIMHIAWLPSAARQQLATPEH